MLLTVQINYLCDTGINEYGKLGNVSNRGKGELLAEIPTYIPLCPPEILQGPTWDRTIDWPHKAIHGHIV